jgi:hypothetical protein
MVFVKFVVIGDDAIDFIDDNNKIIDEVTQHVKSSVEGVEIVETHFNAKLKIGIIEIVTRRSFYDLLDIDVSIRTCSYKIQFV